ncbi:MAG: phospholipase C [Terriglobia bacterium]
MRHRSLLISVFVTLFALQAHVAVCAQKPRHPTQRIVRRYHRAQPQQPSLTGDQLAALLRQKIKYVFVIYQENRSFDFYFGTFPGANGLFSRDPMATPGFYQSVISTGGGTETIHPFRIGPRQFAADMDDLDHSHPGLVAKMDIQNNVPKMDRYVLSEEKKRTTPFANPSLQAKQMGELTMAYVDCDTVPLLWRYALRFTLFDDIFQEMIGPSTLGNISIIAAQTGQTQWALHPGEGYKDNGSSASGVPVMNDDDPFWGSQLDPNLLTDEMPVNPKDLLFGREYRTAINLTFASLPLTLWGEKLSSVAKADRDPRRDLADVKDDVNFISSRRQAPAAFGWYQEGYDKEPYKPDDGPLDAFGLHASYVTHHNGPQYFGYISNNPKMRSELHGLEDFFTALEKKKLPKDGGVFFVKGGYRNIFKLKPADPDPAVQKKFLGDDDHEGYSDSQISEALVAESVNKIAASPYWPESVIIITWDDSEGSYDHVPPPIRARGPDGSPITDGPRVPLILISPYGREHYVAHDEGNHASVVKFVDTVFDLPALALLPDEQRGRKLGEQRFGQDEIGPQDALTPDVTDLTGAFSTARLLGRAAPIPASYVEIPESLIVHLPEETGYGCNALGILPTDRAQRIVNFVPSDFNPRPLTDPSH